MPRKRKQQTEAETHTVLAQIERVIRWSDEFRLAFVKCNSPIQQEEIRRMLLARLSDKQVLEVFLQKPIISLLDELIARWDATQPSDAVCIYGLEKSISEQREASPVLGRLNHDRDLLRRAVPAALLIWLPDFALDCVARGAPDFWAWRSGVYEFPTEVALWQKDSIAALAYDVHALFSLPLEDKQKEIARLEELLRTARALPRQGKREQETISSLLYQLGLLYVSIGEWDIARAQFRESLEIDQRLGDQQGIATVQHSLGVLAQEQGQLEEAEQWYRQSLAIKESLGNEYGRALTLHQLGTIAQERGQLEEAEQWYRQSLAIEDRLGDEYGRALTLHQLGTIAAERGNVAEAVRFFQQAEAIFKRLGDSRHLDIVRTSLQRVHDDSHSRN
ncbi:MAG TPA: tetratricopeptide repeat protein [Candidatus Binatia bacterium]|nr:tetratricopeptide repeat protein [Candidatus Binatia bacterium]